MNDLFRGAEGRALAQRVLETMATEAISPSPNNYAVWAAHLTGANADLSKALEARRREGLDDTVCGTLYTEYLAPDRLDDAVADTGAKMQAELTETISALESAGRDIQAYGDTLEGASGALDAGADGEGLKRVVAKLREETRAQHARNQELESRLQDSTATVRQLQSVLKDTREEAERAKVQAQTDALTGIANRLRFDSALREGVEEANRNSTPYSVILLDIDHFKRFNDTWGHQTGDQIIKFVARCIQRSAEDHHIVARYGGEEFAVLAPGATSAHATVLAEKVRKVVEAKQLMRKSTNESLGTVTVSIGVAQLEGDDGPEEVLDRADRRLYASKRGGRNRVTATGDGQTRPEAARAA